MLASAFWCAALYGVAIQLPDCLLVLGYEHWKTGWVILPMCLIVLASMFVGGFVRHRGALVWLYRVGLAGMTVVGFWLARIDIYTPWQWVMGVSSLWAVFAGMCMSPIAQLTFEGQPPAMAGATGAMKFFMRSFNGTVGILLAGVLIDQGGLVGAGLRARRDRAGPGGRSGRHARHPRLPGPSRQHTRRGRRTGRGGPGPVGSTCTPKSSATALVCASAPT